ncbi:hypothetical protein SK128_019562 [Halocaridina rubra]|uniref:Transmembrane protein n=1 Tax=Halocaridina rubra TaxID=373956 RepID=A0AAN8WNB0_HALRR
MTSCNLAISESLSSLPTLPPGVLPGTASPSFAGDSGETEISQRQTHDRLSKCVILLQVLRRYSISIVAFAIWGIGLFALIRMNENYFITPFVISFACLCAWVVAKVAQGYRRNIDQQSEEEENDQNSDMGEPPPYEIVMEKPPPYSQLFTVSPPSTQEKSQETARSNPSFQKCSSVDDTTAPKEPCETGFDPVEEGVFDVTDLPTYEQAQSSLSSS